MILPDGQSQSSSVEPSRHSFIERMFNPSSLVRYRNDYLQASSTLSYSYLLMLPFLILYELGIVAVNGGSLNGVRIGADILVKQILSFVGVDSTFGFAIIVILIGMAVLLYERRKGIRIQPKYLGYMTLESLGYALLLGAVISVVVGSVFGRFLLPIPAQIPGSTTEPSLFASLVLSLGAGIYEELIFRLLLVSLLYALLFFLKGNDIVRYSIAAVVAALIFSAVHYTGPYGDVFELSSFIFRFLMGLALNVLMLFRGFGITAAAHAFYDIIVTLL